MARYYDYPRDDKGNRVPNNHNILPQKTKKVFERRTFCCYEYNELKPQLEENMFQLVQRGMPLTPAEKLRAMSTNWANFAKQYEQDYPSVIACTLTLKHSFSIFTKQSSSMRTKASFRLSSCCFDILADLGDRESKWQRKE